MSARLQSHNFGADYQAHLAAYGTIPEIAPETLRQAIVDSGLRGRGGGWFPTGQKMQSVVRNAEMHHHGSAVICNAMEGEPASTGDEWLATYQPHLIIDGTELAAHAVGADHAFIAAHEGGQMIAGLQKALAQRPGSKVKIVAAPARYVASEESALARFISGGPDLPVFGQRPYAHGVHGRPTLVNNAESLSHVALIARHGATWFRSVGAADAPGTTLVSVGGDVANPVVVEVPTGTAVADLISAAGGVTGQITGIRTGGYGGTWAGPGLLQGTWDPDGLRAQGIAVGSGILWPMASHRCGIVESAITFNYLAGESAGQCGVCTFGLAATAEDLVALARRQLDAEGARRMHERLRSIPRRGGCVLPDGAVRMAQTALQVFAAEEQAHLNGRCTAASPYPSDQWTPTPPPGPRPVIAHGRHFE